MKAGMGSMTGFHFLAALVVVMLSPVPAAGAEPVAIVPLEVIYPGQAIDPNLLEEVPVTNPNVRSDYISSVGDLQNSVARRTLLPGRVIPISAVREAYAVERGTSVDLVFSSGGLVITAAGTPLENAAVGDFIKVRNIESGITVTGTVMADGSVQVVTQ